MATAHGTERGTSREAMTSSREDGAGRHVETAISGKAVLELTRTDVDSTCLGFMTAERWRRAIKASNKQERVPLGRWLQEPRSIIEEQ